MLDEAPRILAETLHGVAALPALATFAPLLLLARARGSSRRVSFLLATTAWGLILTAITELASARCRLTFWPVLLLWIAAFVFLSIQALRVAMRSEPTTPIANLTALPRSVVVLVGLQLVVLAVLAGIAWTSAPNNWDSHSYHLARVRHWLQQQSVAHYPTSIERQVDAPPWAEFVLAHLMLLAGGDRPANLVQWFALLGSAIGVSLIACRLGARPVGQAAASAVCLALPMAVLQASSTQNDLVVSFWLVAFVALGLEALEAREKVPLRLVLGAGGALGLAALTKGTAYVYAPPFVTWFVVASCRKRGVRRTLPLLAAAGVLALLVNAPHFARNAASSGSLAGPGFVISDGRAVPYANARVSLAGTLSNSVRSLALQLGAPDLDRLSGHAPTDHAIRAVKDALGLPSGELWNGLVVAATSHTLSALGIDPNDPETTWNASSFRVPASGWSFEDTAGNPLHLVLYAALLLWIVTGRSRPLPRILPYIACCAAGFVLFNAVFAWQVYHSRLHLPLFILTSAACATALERALGSRGTPVVAALALLLASPWLVNNLQRPLFGERSILRTERFDQYFHDHPELRDEFVRAADEIAQAGCHDVAVVVSNDAWEYPLWLALDRIGWRAHIEHAGIVNYTAAIADPACDGPRRPPCAEVTITMSGVVARRLVAAANAAATCGASVQNAPSAATSATSRACSSAGSEAIQQTTRCGWPVSTKPTRRARVASPTCAKYALVAPASA